jgi:uncharacterized membrane protein YidH (DUF202 family)
MTSRAIIRLGGLSLAGGALAFLGVFAYLAAQFNYPGVLDGPAREVLPNLLATGTTGRLVWAIYAFLPLIWLPAGVAAYEALAPVRRGAMRLALLFSVVAALAMMLGLMRWPSVHWHLAREFVQAAPPERAVLAAVFDGLNTYLGNYVGEFLGELSFSAFFLLTSIVWLRSPGRARWIGWLGVLTAALGLVGMFRNVTRVVASIAAVNNYLLPAFMIILGVALSRWPAGSARRSDANPEEEGVTNK